jgi:hypothetical protein
VKRVAFALALAAAAAVRTPAFADEPADFIMYKVRTGDSIDLVAAEFYGDHARTALFIVDENKWKTYRKLNPGERIRIPITREITTTKGDSFEGLAKQYLADPSRALYLAQFNGMQPTDLLAAGVVLQLPFHMVHVAQTTETIAAISHYYFDTVDKADLIRRYNNLGDKSGIEKGDTILVPILDVHVHPEHLPAPDADALARRKAHKATTAAAAAAIPVARLAALQGNYGEVAGALREVGKQLEYLDEPAFGEVGMLLGKALVATGDKLGARDVFAAVLTREPKRQLSPYYESPKVLEAWRAASGHVTGEP